MADFLEQVLSSEPVAEPVEPVAEIQPAEPVIEPVAQPEAPAEPVIESPAQPVEQSRDEARHVPLATFLDARDRAKALERELEGLKRQQQPAQVPDPLDDPQGYTAYLNQQLEARVAQERFTMSDVMARTAHGAEAVEAAVGWAQERAASDPSFAMSYMREAHPIDWIVRQHKQSSLLSEIGDNVDDWFTREAAKRGYAIAPAPAAVVPAPTVIAATPAPKPAAPPRSIAGDAPASAPAANDAKAEFEAIFNRR